MEQIGHFYLYINMLFGAL